MPDFYFSPTLTPGYPDFQDLPWEVPLLEWQEHCSRLEEVQRGLSRHPTVFVNYSGNLFAIKQLPSNIAQHEFDMLVLMEGLRLPSVLPVGHTQLNNPQGQSSILITRYLDISLPYRSLFMRSGLDRYRQHLLDAMSGLLVQLHLVGIFWGDCSLSNTLFRRDAGALQAYLVDAETAESHPAPLSPMLRHHDLDIMKENVTCDLVDLENSGDLHTHFPIYETGDYIQQRYRSLWEEITREEYIRPDEHYRIHERIRALNALGFSVKDVRILGDEQGDRLRLRFFVSDRNFHRDQLLELTGLEAEEMQARQMINEIHELKASLSQANNRTTHLSVAAFHWLEHTYQPVIEQLKPIIECNGLLYTNPDPVELYCQVLEHKWYLSEQAHHDVGHQAAVDDFIKRFGSMKFDQIG